MDEAGMGRNPKVKSGSSSGTKLDERPASENCDSRDMSSSGSKGRRAPAASVESDAFATQIAPVEPLRPLPSLDDVLRDVRRQRQQRRAESRKRDRDFMTPCVQCCAAQRRKLTDADGNVNEKKFVRFVVRPGACHHFRHFGRVS